MTITIGFTAAPDTRSPEEQARAEAEWLTEFKADMQARLDLVRVGAWYAMCCELDLYEIETEAEAEALRAELREQIEDPDPPCTTGRIYRSKREALEEFAAGHAETVEEVERRYEEELAARAARRAER